MKTTSRIIFALLSFGIILIVYWIIVNAGEYYLTAQLDRPHHTAHAQWKPGGPIGHGLGVMGSAMIILMFSYSIRKRVKIFRKLGRLPTWLNIHIFLGIAGPILVTFHTSFKFGGLVSVSFWSMIAVALSGFIGRYIYTRIPHRVSGTELTLQELQQNHRDLGDVLVTDFGLSRENLAMIEEMAGVEKIRQRGLAGIFITFPQDLLFWIKPSSILHTLSGTVAIPADKMHEFRVILKKQVKAARQIAFWDAAHRLFHYWHVIHKPFAYTMISIMIIHIAIAVSLGYTWKF